MAAVGPARIEIWDVRQQLWIEMYLVLDPVGPTAHLFVTMDQAMRAGQPGSAPAAIVANQPRVQPDESPTGFQLLFPEEQIFQCHIDADVRAQLIAHCQYSDTLAQATHGSAADICATTVQLARTRSAEERQRHAMADAVAAAESSAQAQLDAEIAATKAEVRHISSGAVERRKAKAKAESKLPGPSKQLKSCGHFCFPGNLEKCCACEDVRPLIRDGTYTIYVDGRGYVDKGKRDDGNRPPDLFVPSSWFLLWLVGGGDQKIR